MKFLHLTEKEENERLKAFEFTEEEKNKLKKLTKNLTDTQIFETIKDYVYESVNDIFNNAMTIEHINNFKKPSEKIYLTEMFKNQLVREFKSDLGVQNNIYKVKEELETGSKYINLWIDWGIWDRINDKNEHIIKEEINLYPELFSNENYQLFEYLNSEYKRDNNALKAKYSNLYHFMKYENLISGTQEMYKEFIYTLSGIKLSKIQPITYKYKDEIQSLLTRLKKQFIEKDNIE